MSGVFNRIAAAGDMLAATYDPASKSEQLLGESDIVTTVGDPGSDTEVPSEQATREALNAIDQKKLKATYFEQIASGTTSGTITKPAGAGADVDFIMDEWGTATDALVSTIENGKPTFKSPVNAAGATITTTLDTSGNYAFSDTPSPAASHALIYVYTCYIKNLNVAECLWETELLDYVADHKTSHENAGSDEISVAGLSGLLADDQHVLDSEVLAAVGINSGISSMTGLDNDGIPLAKVANAASDGANSDITSLGALSGAQTIPTIALTGGQIAFPATAVPSADANTLDDYEEGTWTPVLDFATTGDLSVSYTYQNGLYTKTGNIITVHCFITTSSFTHSTAAGNVKISGLPFTSNATIVQPACALAFEGITMGNYTQFTPVVQQNSTEIIIYGSAQGQARTQLTVSHFPTGGSVGLLSTTTYTE